MGLEVEYIRFINQGIGAVYGQNTKDLTMVELGNQWISPNPVISERFGKDYFTNQGFKHISIDMNGEDGAIPLDLRIPALFKNLFNKVDILTNAGTTEHVEPHECQYECYSIIHNLVKHGGLMVHILPDVHELDTNGAWAGHCTNYYSTEFFEMLSRECGYEIIRNNTINSNRCVALKKTFNLPFMKDKNLFLSYIAQR